MIKLLGLQQVKVMITELDIYHIIPISKSIIYQLQQI